MERLKLRSELLMTPVQLGVSVMAVLTFFSRSLVLVFLFPALVVNAVPFSPPKYSACHSKDFGFDGTVCVCSDEVGCDEFTKGSPLSDGEYAVYTSSKAGDRFNLKTGKMKKFLDGARYPDVEVSFTVNQTSRFQTILGFGGAFTGKLFLRQTKIVFRVQYIKNRHD